MSSFVPSARHDAHVRLHVNAWSLGVQLLEEENTKQFEILYSVRDRLIALEREVDELRGANRSSWFRRSQSQGQDGSQSARHDKLD